MWIAAAEFATPHLSLALAREAQPSEILWKYRSEDRLQHAERLVPKLLEGLEAIGGTFSEICHWVTTTGPGSFTGMRIGLATLKGIFQSQANSPRLTVLRTAEALAALRLGTQSEIRVAIPVRKEAWWVEHFSKEGDGLRTVSGEIQETKADCVEGGVTAEGLLDLVGRGFGKTLVSLEEILSLEPAYIGDRFSPLRL